MYVVLLSNLKEIRYGVLHQRLYIDCVLLKNEIRAMMFNFLATNAGTLSLQEEGRGKD